MAIDFASINKLPPEQRLKTFLALQSQLKKMQEEIRKDIETLSGAIEEAHSSVQVLERIQTPSAKAKTVEEAVEEERPVSPLEQQVQKVPTPDELHQRLHAQQTEDIYKRLSTIFYQTQIQKQEITQYQENFVEAAQREIYERKKHEEYRATDKSESRLSASEKLVKYLRG